MECQDENTDDHSDYNLCSRSKIALKLCALFTCVGLDLLINESSLVLFLGIISSYDLYCILNINSSHALLKIWVSAGSDLFDLGLLKDLAMRALKRDARPRKLY
jgi:hypothetical protein